MARTTRSVPHYVKNWNQCGWYQGRRAQRINKGADGSLSHSICGSANETILNTYDDICPRGGHRHEVKARVHREIRRHLGRDLARRLREDPT